jgi:pyochelin biosynthetic protein PchC
VIDPETWLRPFGKGRPFTPTVVCFPHAGGSAGFFRPIAAALRPAADVLAVQYPGRLDRLREPPITDAGQLADLIAAALRKNTDQPLVLFGHSMGAIVAFETARRLERSGESPVLGLCASGREAPERPPLQGVNPHDDSSLLREVARLGGTGAWLLSDPDLQRTFLPAIRADFRLIHSYRYLAGPPLNCPITAMVGDRDPITVVEEAQAWGGHTAGEFRLRVFPGHHFYLTSCRTEVAAEIAGSILAWRRQREEPARAARQ